MIPWFPGPSSQPSKIEELLQQSAPPIESLLNEEDVVVELKNLNPKLLDYFTQNQDSIKKLIFYITEEPLSNEHMDENRCYKFPFVASQILESEAQPIIAALLQSTCAAHKRSF